ncbi:hypothetical protein ATZ33_00110 [Enterococcus silesiacus]|uniref:FkbH n=1 Tax=Enterococcus silesiacus TaxID=332949 RepID=A0A0S3K6B4_9ENTE|nr:HAD-IIIC family phosphatase [Enterococcus silesiacus]ALR99840.1 hypothetical protein ATZ33_00110 [Enterococcus silesiacus]OJG92857.1 FkbH [Enterococcus silesiacus]
MKQKKIKCVVWDLDLTIWDGVLTEDKRIELRPDVKKIIETLDYRGILQSIASKNDEKLAEKKLKEFGLYDYFIYPEINWHAKSVSIDKIASSINISKDTIAFIDDQEFERNEVSFSHSEILCIDGEKLDGLLEMSEFNPTFITVDSKNRRQMYQQDIERNQIEEAFEGTKEAFLKTLNLKMTITEAKEEDLKRVEELTIRTSQLNSTGTIYSYEDLQKLLFSKTHKMFVVQLDDKYGSYGKIGLALIETIEEVWTIKLLIMSCRVISRGVGNVLLYYVMNKARKKAITLQAEFIPTDRNKIMYITYKFSGFKEVEKTGEQLIFEADLTHEKELPEYVYLPKEK